MLEVIYLCALDYASDIDRYIKQTPATLHFNTQ